MPRQRFRFRILIPEQYPANLQAYFYAVPVHVSQENPELYPLTRQAILTYLHTQGIVYGIQESAISHILESAFAHHELIAVGLPPLLGSDALFEVLVKDKQSQYEAIFLRQPQPEDEQWLSRLVAMTVSPQTPLIRKQPPSSGAPGIDIFGRLIPGLKGQDKPFPPYRNAVVSEQNRMLLVSGIEGIPLIDLPRNIEVLPLTMLSRDMHESAYFRGIVAICGHVADYVRIRAYGDILVLGTVDAAVLLAGRHIWIRQGVKGKDTAVLKAQGNILLRFAERATLEAGQQILAESLHHCYAVALAELHVTYILGGEVLASQGIWTDVAGSPGIDSSLGCGQNAYLASELQSTEASVDELMIELQALKTELSAKIMNLAQTKKILLLHYRNLIPRLEYKIYSKKLRLQYLRQVAVQAQQAAINIETGLYPDTLLRIHQFEKYNHDFIDEPTRFVSGRYGIISDKQQKNRKPGG